MTSCQSFVLCFFVVLPQFRHFFRYLAGVNFTIAVPNLFFRPRSSCLSDYAFVVLLWVEQHSNSLFPNFYLFVRQPKCMSQFCFAFDFVSYLSHLFLISCAFSHAVCLFQMHLCVTMSKES